mgnify:CR=1 FL=1
MFQAEDGIRYLVRSRGLGDVYKRQESEKHGAEFLKRKMEDYGLQNVRLEEFQMAGWERGSASLTLVEPVERSYSCVAMPYCPAADLTAEVIDVGEGAVSYTHLTLPTSDLV